MGLRSQAKRNEVRSRAWVALLGLLALAGCESAHIGPSTATRFNAERDAKLAVPAAPVVAASRRVDRAAFALISTGMRECITDGKHNADEVTEQLQKLFLTMA